MCVCLCFNSVNNFNIYFGLVVRLVIIYLTLYYEEGGGGAWWEQLCARNVPRIGS